MGRTGQRIVAGLAACVAAAVVFAYVLSDAGQRVLSEAGFQPAAPPQSGR